MRSALTIWSRAGLLVLILLMLGPIQSMANAGLYGAPGLRFLQEIVWVNLVCITLAGLSYFASAITEEKEEMMLGLLRMTNLSPVSILLGKSTSRLVGALLLLLVQVPFILLAVTLGGVALIQIAAAYATLLAYLFLVCNLALLLSVLFRTTTLAAAATFALLLLFLLGPYLAGALEAGLVSDPQDLHRGAWSVLTKAIGLWRQTTPSDRLGEIFQTGFSGPALGCQIAANLVMGVLLFFLAWLMFDLCAREEKDNAPARIWLFYRRTRRSRIPPGLVGNRAVIWKDFVFIGGGKFGLLAKFGVIAFLIVAINCLHWELEGRRTITPEVEGGIIFWVSLLATAMFLALDAARVFQEEVRWKTLSSLVTLPMSIPELAYRKVAGILIGTLPLLAGCVVGMALALDDFIRFVDDMGSTEFGGVIVAILQYVLFLHLTAFLSLVIKRGALPAAIAIQYVGGSFFLIFVEMAGMVSGSADGPLFFIGFICVALTIVLHRAIGIRLERAAAAE
jgi:hypothetical protein